MGCAVSGDCGCLRTEEVLDLLQISLDGANIEQLYVVTPALLEAIRGVRALGSAPFSSQLSVNSAGVIWRGYVVNDIWRLRVGGGLADSIAAYLGYQG